MRTILRRCVFLGAMLWVAGRAEAAFTITFSQVGNDVVATGVGSLNVEGLRFVASGLVNSVVRPRNPTLIIGPSATADTSVYAAYFSNRSQFGTGFDIYPSSGAGGVGFDANSGYVFMPTGLAPGASFTSSSTYITTNFALLGLTPGTYTYAYSAFQAGPTIDTFTVQIGPAAVPEPASLVMLGLGLAGLGACARTRGRG